VPAEYWEYRLVEQHFRGNWLVYWNMPEPILEMITGFIKTENEVNRIQEKRLRRKNNGRQGN